MDRMHLSLVTMKRLRGGCLHRALMGLCTVAALGFEPAPAAALYIGAASADITPDRPVALDGQRSVRISKKPETPIQASVLALESRDGDTVVDQVISVSCDLVAIRDGIHHTVREKVRPLLPDFDVSKLMMNATHTHTAPVTVEGKYALPDSGIMRPAEYADWMTSRIAEAVAEAWRKRQPGKAGWGQSQAVIAQNRRATYADGTAAMYGKTNTPNFRGIEGYEDHDVDVLLFWDMSDRLIATAINIPSPAQEVEGGTAIHADFWHPVRERLRAGHGSDLQILAWAGAGGDQTPHLMYLKDADARMRRLRGDLTRLDEIARRIVLAWEDAFEAAQKEKHADPILVHRVKAIELPWREVTILEQAAAKTEAAKFAGDPKQQWNFRWNQSVVERYEAQRAGTAGSCQMELHAIRLGDVAITTNDFELFTDYGIQMKARSPALQTFVLQLSGPGSYLPTPRAVKGGGYSAVIQSSRVGPEGGQVLVNETVNALNEIWKVTP